MTASTITKRCSVCCFPVEDCQCNITMPNGKPNPFLACAWCGITSTKEQTLKHIKECSRNPNVCKHQPEVVVNAGSGKIVDDMLYCRKCQTDALFPSYIQLVFRYFGGKEE